MIISRRGFFGVFFGILVVGVVIFCPSEVWAKRKAGTPAPPVVASYDHFPWYGMGVPPFPVFFHNTSTGSSVRTTQWRWEVRRNDETLLHTASSKNLLYVFKGVGAFKVTLMASRDGESSSYTDSVAAIAVYTSFEATPSEGVAPLTVDFENTTKMMAGVTVDSWRWEFKKEGEFKDVEVGNSEEKNPTFTFEYSGTYAVKIIAYYRYGGYDCVASFEQAEAVLVH